MPADEAIIQEFDNSRSMDEDFTVKVEKLLAELLVEKGARVHSITSRVKERDSLQRKGPSEPGRVPAACSS